MRDIRHDDADIGRDTVTVSSECGLRVASCVRIASTFSARWIGLLRRRDLPAEEGLLIEPGGSVHTFGMRFAIDVLFLDRQVRIVKLVPAMRAGRIALAPSATYCVLEISAGRATSLGLRAGMRLVLNRRFARPQRPVIARAS